MKLNLLEQFEQIPYFTIVGFKQILNAGEGDNKRVREMLSRWMKKGYVIQLKRGIYTTRRFYELHRGDASFVPAVSAILNPQSYISLEYVLQQSSVLTDITYPTTAITIKNTKKIENVVGTFVYRHIRQPLYLGFIQTEYFGVIINQATVPKALFDFFYLRPLPRKLRTTRIDLAEDLRLNVADFSSEERSEFTEYVKISKSAKMDFILENFRRRVWQP